MFAGKLVFAQVMEHLPLHTFRRCVARYEGERKVKHFSCLDQLLVMMFAQAPRPFHSDRLRESDDVAASCGFPGRTHGDRGASAARAE